MTKAAFQEKVTDFSLVMGGPIFQLFRKAHLTGNNLELLHRRVLTIISIAWLPMLVLDLVASRHGIPGRLTFLHDVEVQTRFLVALPVLIFAELIAHSRLRLVVQRFVEREIVRGEDLPRYEAAIESAVRLRNSIPLELALFISVYTLGLWLWNSRFGIESVTWYANPGGRWALYPRRVLVRVFCHSDPAVHTSALVSAVLHLVSLSLAGVEIEPASGSHPSRSLRRARFPG
jgi:hypothetical protein